MGVKFAVVGCGNIGTRHLHVLNAASDADLVGFCDSSGGRLAEMRELFPDVPAFESLDDLLVGSDTDVVNVCTPHCLHAEQGLRVIESGKHLLVEKPMALTSTDAVRMIDAAKAAGVLLMVVKQNRYNLPVQITKRALDAGNFGRLLMVECNVVWNRHDGYYRNSPWLGRKATEGGALFTQVSHFIDLMVMMCGKVIDAGGRIATRTHDIETEDCGCAWLEFDTGVAGSLFWTTSAYNRNFEGSITLLGERGIVKIGGQYLNRIEHWEVEGVPLEVTEWTDKPNSYGNYQGSSSNHDKVFRDVVRAVNREECSVVSGEEAMLTIQAIEKIYAESRVLG